MSKKIDIFQVDAFAKELFSGNPAAVCPLYDWLSDEMMQNIAQENNLAETAFIVKETEGLRIRWFTPSTEVRLCGHATLASGFVFFERLGYPEDTIHFNCLSGKISVSREGDKLTLKFPTDVLNEAPSPALLESALGAIPKKCFKGKDDYLLIFNDENQIKNLSPDFKAMMEVDGRGCIASAQGSDYDVVSRCFFPQSGIDEDPATGSAQTTLAAYWPKLLGRDEFTSCQLSERKGYFHNRRSADRTFISGKCRLFLTGSIFV